MSKVKQQGLCKNILETTSDLHNPTTLQYIGSRAYSFLVVYFDWGLIL